MHLKSLYSKVCEELVLTGVSQQCTKQLEPLFQEQSPYCNPFSGVSTQHHQLAFLQKHFNFIVSIVSYYFIQLEILMYLV